MATVSFQLRQGRCRKDDAARELVQTLRVVFCRAAPCSTASTSRCQGALPWSASAGDAIPHQGAPGDEWAAADTWSR
jgi:hypothetical protein